MNATDPMNPTGPLTAIVLTCNEERHLPDCLASLSWVPRVIVVDSNSSDGTVAIARAAGAQVIDHPFENYARQRQFALAQVDSPWALFVDADERVGPELAAEIRRVVGVGERMVGDRQALESGPRSEVQPQSPLSGNAAIAGYWLPRRNVFWGHGLKGGGWWPDAQLRLLRIGHARYDPLQAVHEVAVLDGAADTLEHPLTHLNYDHLTEFRHKQMAYAALDAEHRRAAGGRVRAHSLIIQPWRAFYRRYVRLAGWRDGPLGLLLCALMAWYELRTLILLRRLQRPEIRRPVLPSR